MFIEFKEHHQQKAVNLNSCHTLYIDTNNDGSFKILYQHEYAKYAIVNNLTEEQIDVVWKSLMTAIREGEHLWKVPTEIFED